MLMSEIYKELETRLETSIAQKEISGKKVEEIKEKLDALQKAYEAVAAEYKTAQGNVDALQMAMESLSELGDFKPSDDEVKVAKKEEETKLTKGQLTWKHRTAIIVQYGKNGGVTGKYRTQKEVAEKLGCHVTRISQIMKENEKLQLKRRGFVLKYEY